MPAYRAVLFDFYGTLTHAVERGRQHDAVADLLGCDRETLMGVLDRSFRLRAAGALGDARACLRWICGEVGTRPSKAALRAALAARLAAVGADTRLRPEAVPVLRTLRRAGVRTGMVSDCTHELPLLLPRLPVASLLQAQIFSVRAGRCKPDPLLYLSACERLGVAPEDCLYVGDGGSQELTGAARLGMTAVRLAAPDLSGHLVFDADTGWAGPQVSTLCQVTDLVDGAPGAAGTASGWPGRRVSGPAVRPAKRRAASGLQPVARPPAPAG